MKMFRFNVYVEQIHSCCVPVKIERDEDTPIEEVMNQAQALVATQISGVDWTKNDKYKFEFESLLPSQQWAVEVCPPVVKNPKLPIICGHNDLWNHNYYTIECQDGSLCDVCDDCMKTFDFKLLTDFEVKEYYAEQGKTCYNTDYVNCN